MTTAADTSTTDLRIQRTAIIHAHVDAENQHDLAAVIASFSTLQYAIVPFDSLATGAAAVTELLTQLFKAFPNLYTEIFTTYHADTAVIIEGRLVGTHLGLWSGIPASGRVINLPLVAIFDFDGAHLVGKRLYFDAGLMLRQLAGEF